MFVCCYGDLNLLVVVVCCVALFGGCGLAMMDMFIMC